MPKVQPSQERAHLLVAAVRVLRHRSAKPPLPAEVAEMLEWSEEETLAVIRGLADAGILDVHETPFEIRLEVADHRGIEELPTEADKKALQGEVDAFRRKSRERKEALDRLFESGEQEQRRKDEVKSLEEEFEEFRKRGRRKPNSSSRKGGRGKK